jgi:hypothetical protein
MLTILYSGTVKVNGTGTVQQSRDKFLKKIIAAEKIKYWKKDLITQF